MAIDPIERRFRAIEDFELSETDRTTLRTLFEEYERALGALELFAEAVPWPDLPETPAREAR